MLIPLGAKVLGGTALVSAGVAVVAQVESANPTVVWAALGTALITSITSIAMAWINRSVRADVAKAVVKIDEVKDETAVIKKDVNSGLTETKNALSRANEIIAEQAGLLAELRTERTERNAANREANVAAREVEVARQEPPPAPAVPRPPGPALTPGPLTAAALAAAKATAANTAKTVEKLDAVVDALTDQPPEQLP